jgi:V/A-type H+-transporting ATPase subunit G/H
MPAEKTSVLQQIRKKEVELSVRVDQARVDAEQMVTEAKKEATDVLKNAEIEGRRVAEEYNKEKMATVLKEVDDLRRSGEAEVEAVRLKGEHNLSKAIDKIINVVISG